MVAWYRRDIAAWTDGTECLTHLEYRVYDVVISLIYWHEGPIVRNDYGLAGRCKTTTQGIRVALEGLKAKGKLVETLGKLSNGRAQVELTALGGHREHIGMLSKASQRPLKGVVANPLKSLDATRQTRLEKKEKEKEDIFEREGKQEDKQEKLTHADPPPTRVWLHIADPRFDAWTDYYRSTGKPSPPTGRNAGAYFPADWPPGHPLLDQLKASVVHEQAKRNGKDA